MTLLATLCALGSAACYGGGDFLGGMAARRLHAIAVVALSHAFSLLLIVPVAVMVGAASVGAGDLGCGAAAGLIGGTGVGLLYAALARGVMSVVAPVTAACAATVPVVVGLAQGERPGAVALAGVSLAVAAVVLLGWGGQGPAGGSGAARTMVESLGAGLAFGFVYVLLARAGGGSGLWPLVAQRSVSASLFGGLALAGGMAAALPARPRAVATTLVCGVLDTTANVLYLTAARHGLLSLAAVLASLYPVGTVLLARAVLGERLAPIRSAGLALALAAVILIAL